MHRNNPVVDAFLDCLSHARHVAAPFDHWLIGGALPEQDMAAVEALPFPPPEGAVFDGKRETNNSVRVFFNRENQERFEVCRRVGARLQDARVLRAIEETTGADLSDAVCASNIARTRKAFGSRRTPTSR